MIYTAHSGTKHSVSGQAKEMLNTTTITIQDYGADNTSVAVTTKMDGTALVLKMPSNIGADTFAANTVAAMKRLQLPILTEASQVATNSIGIYQPSTTT